MERAILTPEAKRGLDHTILEVGDARIGVLDAHVWQCLRQELDLELRNRLETSPEHVRV